MPLNLLHLMDLLVRMYARTDSSTQDYPMRSWLKEVNLFLLELMQLDGRADHQVQRHW